MDRSEIVVKTAAGIDEVKTRSRKLSQRLRSVLIMIDGRLTVGQLTDAAAGLALPDDFLRGLERDGLIEVRQAPEMKAPITVVDIPTADEPAPAAPTWTDPIENLERFQRIQKFMNEGVLSALGFRAFFFTLLLDECRTRDDLAALLPKFEKAVAKGSGPEVAKVMAQRLREMLR